jgi:hypothetical protein
MSYIKADSDREQEYFDYLEDLRKSGETNMFGAGRYLQAAFRLGGNKAREVLVKWMKAHDDPKRLLKKPLSKTKKTVAIVEEAHIETEERP